MNRRSLLRSLLVVAVVAVVALGGALAWLKLAPRRVPAGQPALGALAADSLPAFRDAFNAAAGEVRVLALLSPT